MVGIIFDCDGTLIDSEAIHFTSWKMAVEKRGGILTQEEYTQLAGKTGDAISQNLHDRSRFDTPEALKKDKNDYYLQLVHKGIPPIEKMVHFVRELEAVKKELGIKLAVVSAGHKEVILLSLQQLNLFSLFDVVVSGAEDLVEYNDPEGVNKPKPYIYLHAAKLLGLDPKQCIAFEDSSTGLLAAVTAGMTTIAVPNEFTKSQDFSRAAYVIEPSAAIDIDDFFLKLDLIYQK